MGLTRPSLDNFARVVADESLLEASSVHVLAQNLDPGSARLRTPSRPDGLDLGVDELKVHLRLAPEVGHLHDDGAFSRLLETKKNVIFRSKDNKDCMLR